MTASPDHGVTPCTVESIEEAEKRWDVTAKLRQRRTIAYAFVTTSFAPFAVVLLALQVVLYHGDHPVISDSEAGMLIGLELALIATVLVIGYTGFGPNPLGWASARIRAEVLRRETFLLRARLGPYLDLNSTSGEIRRRLMAIELEDEDPAKLLSLSDARGHWRDQYEESQRDATKEADILKLLRDYAENRIGGQLEFYRNKAIEHQAVHTKLESIAKFALVLALMASAGHLAFIETNAHGPAEELITIASLVLPTVTAAVAGWQSFCQSNRLKLTYRSQAVALEEFADLLSRLEDKIVEETASGEAEVDPRHYRELRRIILRAEEMLANEQIQWWTLINSWTATA